MNLLQAALGREHAVPAVSPWLEMGAYEALWDTDPKASFKSIADRFRSDPDALPSDFVNKATAAEYAHRTDKLLKQRGVNAYGVRLNGTGDYPAKLRDARHPIELLYYQGEWGLADTPCVAVVGTREPSDEGIKRARQITKCLIDDGYTIVSGLAAGIDTVAHMAAIEYSVPTIAVIGTPIGVYYPRANEGLQRKIAEEHLVISQVPNIRYHRMPLLQKRSLFPERNVTMSALTLATIIIEASNTSGTLKQAQAALHQGRKLFILNSCFERPDLTWPARFAEQGAIRVRDYNDIRSTLSKTPAIN